MHQSTAYVQIGYKRRKKNQEKNRFEIENKIGITIFQRLWKPPPHTQKTFKFWFIVWVRALIPLNDFENSTEFHTLQIFDSKFLFYAKHQFFVVVFVGFIFSWNFLLHLCVTI